MAEKSRSELTIDLVKALAWPTITAMVIFWLGSDVKDTLLDILKNRNWRIGNFESGELLEQRVENLKTNVQTELDEQKELLQQIIEDPSTGGQTQEYATKALSRLNLVQREVNSEISSIQQAVRPSEQTIQYQLQTDQLNKRIASNEAKAQALELEGFMYLVQKNAKAALQAFTEAEDLWPEYHNVAEIRALLQKNIRLLDSPESPQWKKIYDTILENYSWGMPAEMRKEIRTLLQG